MIELNSHLWKPKMQLPNYFFFFFLFFANSNNNHPDKSYNFPFNSNRPMLASNLLFAVVVVDVVVLVVLPSSWRPQRWLSFAKVFQCGSGWWSCWSFLLGHWLEIVHELCAFFVPLLDSKGTNISVRSNTTSNHDHEADGRNFHCHVKYDSCNLRKEQFLSWSLRNNTNNVNNK